MVSRQASDSGHWAINSWGYRSYKGRRVDDKLRKRKEMRINGTVTDWKIELSQFLIVEMCDFRSSMSTNSVVQTIYHFKEIYIRRLTKDLDFFKN